MSQRRKKSCKSKQSSASDTQTTDYSDQTTDSSESYTKLEEKNESFLTDPVNPETKKDEQRSVRQKWSSQNDGPKCDFKKRSLIKTDNSRHGQSHMKTKMSRGTRNHSVNKSTKRYSPESQKSTDSGAQMSSGETTESSENSLDLNTMFESSLYVSEKPDSNTTKLESCENKNSPGFKENKSDMQSRLPSIIKSVHHTSGSKRNKFPQKTVRFEAPHFNNKTFHPKHDVWLQEPPFQSRGRPPYQQNFPSMFPTLYPPGYRPNTYPVFPQPSGQNRAYAYTKQYPSENIMGPRSAFIPKNDRIVYQPQTALPGIKQNNTVQSQFPFPACPVMPFHRYGPPPNANTTARPFHMLSCNTRSPYHRTPMPPRITNARPMRFVPPPLMPPCRTNVVHLPYYPKSSYYRRKELPIEKFTTPIQCSQEPKAGTTPDVCKRIESPSEATENEVNSTSKEPSPVSKSPLIQPEPSELKEKDALNTTALNLEQTENLAKAEECQKTSDSDQINLKEEDPKEQLPTTYFPSCSTAQGITPPRALQKTFIEFSKSSRNDFINASTVEQENISSQTYLGRGDQVILNDYTYNSTRSSTHSLTQSTISEKSYRLQYQPTQKDLSAVSKYQDPNQHMHQLQNTTKSTFASQYYKDSNQPIHPYKTEYQPNMQNLVAATRYQNPKLPTYQYGVQNQSMKQGVFLEPQYQKLYAPMNQYQTPRQNTATVSQYQNPNFPINQNPNFPINQNPNFPINQNPNFPISQNPNFPINQNPNLPFHRNPNQPISQHGTQTSAESAWIIEFSDLSSYPIYDASTLTQKNPNTLSMQTHVTNPTSIQNQVWPYESSNRSYQFTGDSNLPSNISGVPASKENLSFGCMNPYPPMPYATNEKSQICSFGSYPETKFYPAWSISDDSQNKILI